MENNVVETAKTYHLRELNAEDVFPMFKIISKIGIKECKACFDAPDVKKTIASMAAGETSQADLSAVGLSVILELANLIMSNLHKCKDDLYLFLSGLSGMDKEEIARLPLATFAEMIIDVVKKDEFKDFFQVVSKLLK